MFFSSCLGNVFTIMLIYFTNTPLPLKAQIIITKALQLHILKKSQNKKTTNDQFDLTSISDLYHPSLNQYMEQVGSDYIHIHMYIYNRTNQWF